MVQMVRKEMVRKRGLHRKIKMIQSKKEREGRMQEWRNGRRATLRW